MVTHLALVRLLFALLPLMGVIGHSAESTGLRHGIITSVDTFVETLAYPLKHKELLCNCSTSDENCGLDTKDSVFVKGYCRTGVDGMCVRKSDEKPVYGCQAAPDLGSSSILCKGCCDSGHFCAAKKKEVERVDAWSHRVPGLMPGQEPTGKYLAILAALDPPLMEGELLCECRVPEPNNFVCGIAQGVLANVCRVGAGGLCLKIIEKLNDDADLRIRMDCVAKEKISLKGRPLMCYQHELLKSRAQRGCCQNYSFCSSDIKLTLAPKPPQKADSWLGGDGSNEITHGQLIIIGVGLAIICLLILLGYLVFRYRVLVPDPSTIIGPPPAYSDPKSTDPLLRSAGGDVDILGKLLHDMLDVHDGFSVGSGAGLPVMVQRTIARQITRKQLIGKGRFGQVYLGEWMGEPVAVKVFSSRDEASWFREVEVYNSTMLIHPNILRFIAADNYDHTTHTELWLVSEFIHNGSLFDYLTVNTITGIQLLNMARSLCNGLQHLHQEIGGTCCKPAIAHRDMKSKNVLVKANGDCVIADLGLAVKYQNGTLDLPNNAKVGTRRYLAPELLESTFNGQDFDAYKMADIYGMSLILWEMATRTNIDGKYETYELPYSDAVGPDPTEEEMHRVVCTLRRRPLIPNRWHDLPILGELSVVIKECWRAEPSARLNALRVKKNIDRILRDHPQATTSHSVVVAPPPSFSSATTSFSPPPTMNLCV